MSARLKMAAVVGLAVFGALSCEQAKAQAEIAPDYFESPNMQLVSPAANSALHAAAPEPFRGEFTLTHSVRCNGKTLPTGQYSVEVRSAGARPALVLNRSGRVTTLYGVALEQVPRAGRDAVVIGRVGKVRKLLEVRVRALQMMFEPAPATMLASNNGPQRPVEEIPLVSSDTPK